MIAPATASRPGRILRVARPLLLGVVVAIVSPSAPAAALDLQEQDRPEQGRPTPERSEPDPPDPPPDPQPTAPQPGQTSEAPEPPLRRFEVVAGGGLAQGTSLGSADANLRAGSLVPRDFQLFTTTTRLASAPFVEVGLGTALTHRIGIEGRVTLSRPELRTRVTGDIEDAPSLTVSERIERWVVEGSVFFSFDQLQAGAISFVPFVMAGGGYLRELHGGRSLVEEGQLYHAGGGARHWLFTTPKGAIRAAGIRADVRVYVVVGGDALDEGVRVRPAIAGAFFMVF